MTVGVYAVAIGENKWSQLQGTVMQALAKHPEIVQVHGRDPYYIYYSSQTGDAYGLRRTNKECGVGCRCLQD